MQPPPRIVTLVVDDPRGVLPAIEVASPWWMESGPVVEAARSAFGVEITVLRLLEGKEFPGGPVTYLVEAPGVDPSLLGPWPNALDDDLRGVMYARPGGVADLTSWADQAIAEQGLPRRERTEQVRTWNLSCLLRLHLADGSAVWLKAVPSFFEHEPDVMTALHSVAPTLVPDIVATRPGVSLMHQAGQRDGYDIEPARHFAAVGRFDEARRDIDLGTLDMVPRFDPHQMVAELTTIAELHGAALEDSDRAKLVALIDQVRDRWAAAGELETLVHGDLHGGNMRLGDDAASDAILDWGDASITHPLFDLAVLDSYTPQWGSESTDRWLDLLGSDRQAWSAFRPLAAIRLAIVYQRFCDNIEASEQIYHRHDIVPALHTGLEHFHG